MTVLKNVTVNDNVFENSPQGLQMSGRSLGPGNGGGMSQASDFLAINGNLFLNIGDVNQWGPTAAELAGGAGSPPISLPAR